MAIIEALAIWTLLICAALGAARLAGVGSNRHHGEDAR